jgi:hypothetical protein
MSDLPPRPRVIRARDAAPRGPSAAPPSATPNTVTTPDPTELVPGASPSEATIDLGVHLRALLADLAAHVPEAFGPVDTSRLLLVVGAARREARATIRPLTPATDTDVAWHKPEVSARGVTILYEIALRPLYFRATSPPARVLTLAHELWHAGPTFDGSLPPARRHRVARGAQVEAEVTEALARWRQRSPHAARLSAAATAPGLYRLDAWLCRPPSRIPATSSARRRYGDADLYPQLIEQL